MRQEQDEQTSTEELPLFANDEAKAIFIQIVAQREAVEKAETEHTEHEERLKVMSGHLKNVRRELTHTTDLVRAKSAEIKSESHSTELAKREAGRYEQELRHEQVVLERKDARLHTLQNAVFEANEQMDKFKLEMNWNQDELEQWALAAKQKDEDDLAMQRYTRADDVRINALSLHLEKLTKLELSRKIACDVEKTETAARQIELERTAEEFRALHAERQRLLRQWRDAVEASTRRDRDISDVAAKYVEERRLRKAKLDDIFSERARLKSGRQINVDLESKTTATERSVSTRREELSTAKETAQRNHEEAEVLKAELANSARNATRKRRDNAALTDACVQRRTILDAGRALYHLAKSRYEEQLVRKAGVEETATAAEYELKIAESARLKGERELETLKQALFKLSKALFALRQAEANRIAELSGAQAQRRNLDAKVRRLDSESTRQLELVYTAEFQIQQMERKVARGLGERSDDEKRLLELQISKLEEDCATKRDQSKMLTQQTRRLNNELRGALRRKESARDAEMKAAATIIELELHNAAAERVLSDRARADDEAMVKNDVMRLKLKRLRDLLANRADLVYTLDNRKQQLALSLAERKREIALHSDVVAAQLRFAGEETHIAQLELGGRKLHVAKLAAKFETLTKSSKLRAGEQDESRSQAFYLIAAAQKREELQRVGDDLDLQIRQREREMRALEATLTHVNGRNSAYRDSFQKADGKSADKNDLFHLRGQEKLANDALFRRKKALQRLATDHDEDSRRLEQVQAQCERLQERNGHLREAKKQMDVELEAADASLWKLHARLARLSEMHRDKSACKEETVQERDFAAEALADSTKSVKATVIELGKAYPEINQPAQVLLSEISANRATMEA